MSFLDITLFAVLACIQAPADQVNGRLTGQVVAQGQNTPIANARVSVFSMARPTLGPPQMFETTTDSEGRFVVENVPPGARAHGGSPFGGQWSTGGAGGGFRTMSEEEVAEMFGGDGGDSPFSDFFKTFFGGMGAEESTGARGGRARPRARKGQDVEHPFELDLEDAIRGSVQRLQLRHDGHARTVEVRIPAGVTDGSRVRVPGEGGRGSGSAASGDLYLRVQLKPHPVFDVKGRDVYTKARVPVPIAVLGGEVDVVTPESKTLRLKIPAGTQSNQRFRLRGHGLPVVGKPDERGDLYANIEVDVPKTLTDDERKHYEAIRDLKS